MLRLLIPAAFIVAAAAGIWLGLLIADLIAKWRGVDRRLPDTRERRQMMNAHERQKL
jgi:hypothetical protein